MFQVQRDGLDGWSGLSPVPFRSQTVDYKRGSSVVHSISRGRRESSRGTAMPIFKVIAAVGDGSFPLSVRY